MKILRIQTQSKMKPVFLEFGEFLEGGVNEIERNTENKIKEIRVESRV